MRIVFDTNVLVSMALAKSEPFRAMRQAWREGQFHVLVSPELRAELGRILGKPKIKKLLSPARARQLLLELDLFAVPVEIQQPFPTAPDPDDAFLLAMLQAGQADVLVTGDKALLELVSYEGAAIMNVRGFASALRES